MLLLPTTLNKKSAKFLDRLLNYLAIAISVFNLLCSLFKTSSFQYNTHRSIKKMVYFTVGSPNHFSTATD